MLRNRSFLAFAGLRLPGKPIRVSAHRQLAALIDTLHAALPRAGEAITHKIMAPELVSILFLVVALSMALTPFLADGGARLSKAFDKGDMKARPALRHFAFSM